MTYPFSSKFCYRYPKIGSITFSKYGSILS